MDLAHGENTTDAAEFEERLYSDDGNYKRWERFSEIQGALFLIVDNNSIERFNEWVKTGDDNDAWS